MSDDEIDGDQTQDELIPSPSEFDDYSGLSDDLDLENDDIEGINESDPEVNFSSINHKNIHSSFFY